MNELDQHMFKLLAEQKAAWIVRLEVNVKVNHASFRCQKWLDLVFLGEESSAAVRNTV